MHLCWNVFHLNNRCPYGVLWAYIGISLVSLFLYLGISGDNIDCSMSIAGTKDKEGVKCLFKAYKERTKETIQKDGLRCLFTVILTVEKLLQMADSELWREKKTVSKLPVTLTATRVDQ